MSYKDINEKYRKILEEDKKKRAKEEQKELNEVLDTNKQKAFKQFKMHKKEVDKLMNNLEKKITNISADFMMGKFKGTSQVDEIKKIRETLEKIV